MELTERGIHIFLPPKGLELKMYTTTSNTIELLREGNPVIYNDVGGTK